MIEKYRKELTFVIVNKEQFKLLEHVLKLVGEEIYEVEDEKIFNQITYVDYSTTRSKWVVRPIIYKNNKEVRPLISVLREMCKVKEIDFFIGHNEGVTCVEVGESIFTFEI